MNVKDEVDPSDSQLDVAPITLRRFSRDETPLYEAYLQLKYEVFVSEQGWTAIADTSRASFAREDQFDARGRFWLASTEDMVPVGVVRGLPLKEGFPHADLLEHHVRRPEIALMFRSLSTINGLAVRESLRGRPFRAPGLGWVGSIGKLLMLATIRDLETEGMEAVIATAGNQVSAKLFESLGFTFIDRPMLTGLHPDPLINIGLVFGSPRHVHAQKECRMWNGGDRDLSPQASRLLAYFDGRREELFGGRPIEEILPGPCAT